MDHGSCMNEIIPFPRPNMFRLDCAETFRLIVAFSKIKDRETRLKILAEVEAIVVQHDKSSKAAASDLKE